MTETFKSGVGLRKKQKQGTQTKSTNPSTFPTLQRRVVAHAIDSMAATKRKLVVKVFTNPFTCGIGCQLSQQGGKHERHSHKGKERYTWQV